MSAAGWRATLRDTVVGAVAIVSVSAVSAAELDYHLRPRQVAEGVYVFEGANDDFSTRNGCNIINTGFVVTGAGVVVINTGPSRLYGEQQRAAIRRITAEPVVRVLNLNLHPDYLFGNQAYADVAIGALPGTIRDMRAEAPAFLDNLYRICGDWMKGTEFLPASVPLDAGDLRIGDRILRLQRLEGHTNDDLIVIDERTGVLFAGGLVFHTRVPTTPHARIGPWLASLEKLRELPFRVLVPSHGHVAPDASGIDQTRDYLGWLDATLDAAAREGRDLNEVLAVPMPERFRGFAAREPEYVRNVTHLYGPYERRALEGR
ncbi:MAG TPA: quinoprotein relay system zinc metallohydrolase 1 [Rhodocyclaceae bacterium]|nr:quinoprotein relay system zinc metallohydrolase 1 [Rhodocyclaceae bacterium]HNH36067.1 quinoprotein relay system zinc metallohydrolase 1 [Rhodocyclaceae bacterium]